MEVDGDIVAASTSTDSAVRESTTENENEQLPFVCEPEYKNFKFLRLVKFFEKIHSAKNRSRKLEVLYKFFHTYRSKEVSFYPVLRLVLPQWDRGRDSYGLKEHNLAKKYIKILSLPPKCPDALKLLNFRVPGKAGQCAGDFAMVAYSMLRLASVQHSDYSLHDVNDMLTQMTTRHHNHDPRGVEEVLTRLTGRMSALEQKWLIRIILKDVPLGVGHKAVLNAFHPDASELHDACNNLFRVCEELKDRDVRLNEIGIRLFDPFRPMLAERCDVSVVSVSDTHFVEPKWDGERFQLHFSDGKFKYFSRNGIDFTKTYGEDGETGYFTPKIQGQFKDTVNSCILDGEMMGWNTRKQQFGSKAMNFDVKLLKSDNIIQPCFCVFDILYFNGIILTNKSYYERMAILDTVFTPLEGVIIQTKRTQVENVEEVLSELNKAIDRSEEGIILKSPSSVYKPNGRADGWFKIKPEFTEGAMVELDLLIVGGYYGEGRQSGVVSHFLLGLARPTHLPSFSLLGDFVSVCKVYSGLSDVELETLSRKLEPHWTPYRADKPPHYLHLGKETPDLCITPPDSVILQVKASEVMRSEYFPQGYTLRFVRIEKVRYDKPWHNTLTTDEFDILRQRYDGKLTKGHIATKADLPTPSRKRKLVESGPQRVRPGPDTHSQVFGGKEMYLVSGTPQLPLAQLRQLVLDHGGTVIDSPVSSTWCGVGGESNLRLRNLLACPRHNIISCDWVSRCASATRLLPLLPQDFLAMTPETDAAVTSLFNRYVTADEDSPTMEYIKEIVLNFSQYKEASVCVEDVGSLYYLLYREINPAMFRGCRVYFDIYTQMGSKEMVDVSHVDMEMYYLVLLGGKILSELSPLVTHVVVHQEFMDNLKAFNKCSTKLTFVIVSSQWIRDSITSSQLESVDPYLLS